MRLLVQGEYYEAAATNIDPEAQTVTCMYQKPNCKIPEERRQFTVPYDVLVVAVRLSCACLLARLSSADAGSCVAGLGCSSQLVPYRQLAIRGPALQSQCACDKSFRT